jgi:hypothetical protein
MALPKKGNLQRYRRAIDMAYLLLHEQRPDECIRNLKQIRIKLTDLLHESKISEEGFQELNIKIPQ